MRSRLRLPQLLDMSVVQRLAEANHTANGMPIGIIDALDDSVLVGYGWQDICLRFHRAHPRSLERCQKSDRFIRGHVAEAESGSLEYTCENGLRDIAIPIVVSGKHLATLFLGQFFYEGESPDRDFFVRQARELGYDEGAYLAALDRVPIFPRRSVENIVAYNRALARFIADLAEGRLREEIAQEQLREAEDRLGKALRASKTTFFDWDLAAGELRHDPRFWSEVPAVIRGSVEEIAEVLAVPEDRERVSRHMHALCAEAADLGAIEHRRPTPEGRPAWVRAVGEVVERDAAGRPLRLCGTVTDISALVELQERASRVERMASLGTLAGGIAHEINNPLSYILGNLRLVCEALTVHGEQPEQIQEARILADEALQGAERVRRIVRDLLAFARPSTQTTALDLHRVMDLAVSIATSRIRFHARLVKDYGQIPYVKGDELRLSQLLLNLLINAAQAIPDGKPEDHQIRVATTLDRPGRVRIEVSDTGCGIAPDIRSRVFEPFFSTKPHGNGTGLGLSICHGIVTSLEGEITFESELGKGTTFRVLLPAADGSADTPQS
jgi:signal transduction histidine kinase